MKLPSIVSGQLSVAKHLSLVLFFLAFLFTLSTLTGANSVHAQVPCPDNPAAANTINSLNTTAVGFSIYDDKLFNLNQQIGTVDALYTMMTGCSIVHPQTNSVTAGTGALAAASRLVATLYTQPPVSGVNYMAYQMQKLDPIKPAYAQTGIGYQALSPVIHVWEQFRNAAYALFVIIFVIIGFMIMFRAHISPQAVATVQDTLPRLVVALILVTFSYAIAGFMIDLMFLVLNIIINLLNLGPGANVIFDRSIIGVLMDGWGEVVSVVAWTIDKLIRDIASGGALGIVVNLFNISGIAGSIAGLIIGVAIFFIMFRIFFMLIQAYAMIIILTIFAPFFFLFQALPGQNGARTWFIQMASQVLTFVVVAVMILLAGFITGIRAFGGTGAPLGTITTEATKFPLLTGGFGSVVGLIAIGFLMITPEAASLVKNFMNIRTPGFGGAGMAAAGAGAAVAFAGPRGAVGGMFREVTSRGQTAVGYRIAQKFPGLKTGFERTSERLSQQESPGRGKAGG